MKQQNLIIQLLRENGLYWSLLIMLEKLFGSVTSYFQNKRIALEIRKQLPGFNTRSYNYREWSNYNWTEKGEEWTDSAEWKKTLIENTVSKYFQPRKDILEIGPGAGRWSVILATIANSLTLVDLTSESLHVCRQRLASFSHCKFYQTDGRNLSFIAADSIDYVWSFDVFVHIAPADTETYIHSLSSILRKGGIAIIHHPAYGGYKGGFRSSTTNHFFQTILTKYGFRILEQLDSWGDKNIHTVKAHNDLITVFEKV